MKKILLLSVLSSLLLAEKNVYFHLGAAQSDFKYQTERVSENVYSLGYGVEKTFRSGIYSGIQFNFDYANLDNEYMLGYGADFKLGLSVGPRYKLYGVGSAQQQTMSKTTNAYGFGFGGGMSYDFTNSLVGYSEFKRFDMKEEKLNDYTFDTLNIGLKIKF